MAALSLKWVLPLLLLVGLSTTLYLNLYHEISQLKHLSIKLREESQRGVSRTQWTTELLRADLRDLQVALHGLRAPSSPSNATSASSRGLVGTPSSALRSSGDLQRRQVVVPAGAAAADDDAKKSPAPSRAAALFALRWAPAEQPWYKSLFPFGEPRLGDYGTGVPSTDTVTAFLAYSLPWISCGGRPPLQYGRPPANRPVRVVDLIMVAYDIDALETRLYEHAPHVDTFVIVESDATQRGAAKPMYFEYYRARFRNIEDRIVYRRHNATIRTHAALATRKDDWVNEGSPRQILFAEAKQIDATSPKRVIFLNGDVDEFWSREALGSLVQKGPVRSTVAPTDQYHYHNGVYTQPEVTKDATGGAINVAWGFPQPTLPTHGCDGNHGGVGFTLHGFFSPFAWLCKDLAVAEGGGISAVHGSAAQRIRDPYTTFNALRVGKRPCCVDNRAWRLRNATTDPVPHLLRDQPTRFPYLMGDATRCLPYLPEGEEERRLGR